MNFNNIRKQDEIKNECLIEENNFKNEHDKQLQEILYFTLLERQKEIEKQTEYEKKCIEDYENMKKSRKEQFTLLLN